jgi:folate-binding protein YgfZ
MIRLQDLSVITLTGRDADVFLHNQLTADIKALAPGDCTFAALCQPKGRVMALLLVQAVEGGLRAVCHRSLAESLAAYLLRFRFRDKVEITVDTTLAVVSLDNQDALLDALVPLPGVALGIVSGDAAPAPDPLAAEHIAARHLALGVVWLDETTTEQFLPQMLGEDVIGALNFRKGCFPGQEVIARTRYLGKLKRHPWTGYVDSDEPLEPMQALELTGSGQAGSGVLVAQARRAEGGRQLFIVARRPEAFEVKQLQAPGETLEVNGEWLSAAEAT